MCSTKPIPKNWHSPNFLLKALLMRKNDLNFSFKLLKEAVNEFKTLLNSQQELEEKKDLQPFFRKYPILLLAIADLGDISKTNVDELEFEFDLCLNKVG